VPPRSADALAPIEDRGIRLYRTWRQGAIRFRLTGAGATAIGYAGQNDDLSQSMVHASVLGAHISFASARKWKLFFGLIGIAAGMIACAALAVVEIAAWSLVAPSRSRADDGADDLAGRDLEGLVRPIEVRAPDGARLAGRFMLAQRSIPAGHTVLLLHGFAETSRALEKQRMAALSQHGWNVAAVDLRAYGESDGPYATFGGRESGDVSVWFDRLAECVARDEPLSGFRPVLWGRSMGAQIALRAAANDARVAALVLESPLVDLASSVAVPLRQRRFPMPGILARLILRRARKLTGMPLDRPRPIDLARLVTCPVLILHGTLDNLVPAGDVRRLAAAFPNPSALREVQGASHADVIAVGGESLLDQVAAFLDEAVGHKEPTAPDSLSASKDGGPR
jgi:alpha-beta hydrolase superfamily lysophospholipase